MEKFIKIENPCAEPWENMHEVSGGRFCDMCSKKVLDLTQKSDTEILKLIDNANGSQICGHVYKSQLNRALLNQTKPEEKDLTKKNFPYTKIAASVLLATSLVSNSCINNNAQTKDTASPTEQTENNSSKENQEKDKIGNNFTKFTGNIVDENSLIPIVNAKITWITLNKTISVFTDKNGDFSLEIPQELLNTKNVVVLNFDEIKNMKEENQYYYYETLNKIISKNDLQNKSLFKIERQMPIDGGIMAYSGEYDPTVFIDGEEISYEEFQKSNLEKRKMYHFHGEFAKTLYNDVSDDGLILVYSK